MDFLKKARKKILSDKKTAKLIQNLAKIGSLLVYLLVILIGAVTFLITKKNYPETLIETKQKLLSAGQIPKNLQEFFDFSFLMAMHADIIIMLALLTVIILRYLSYENKLESNMVLNSISAIMIFTFFMGEFYYLGFFTTLLTTVLITTLYMAVLHIIGFIGEKEISLLKKELEKQDTPKKG